MPKKTLFLLLFLLICAIRCPATGSAFGVRHIDVSPGLSNTMINAIYQDSRGFLWIGTSSGLLRYDGYGVTTFRGADSGGTSVLNNYIEDIQEDDGGRLWVLADNEWRIYDPATDRETDDIAPLLRERGIAGRVSTVMIDSDKRIWVAVDGKGIYRIGKEGTSHVALPEGTEGKITDIVETAGGPACALSDGSLIFVDAKTMRARVPAIDTAGADSREFVYNLHADRKGRLWIYSNERLRLYDMTEGRWLTGSLPEGGRAGVVKRLYDDRKGKLWISRDHHGLERVTDKGGEIRFEPVAARGGLDAHNTVTGFYDDPQGTLWIGTYKQGLFAHNESVDKFRREDFPDTNCIVGDGDDGMWVGTDNAGLWHWNVKTGERHAVADPADGQQPPAITSLLRTDDGTLYIGSFSQGLRRLKDGKFSKVTTGTSLDDNYIWTLAADADGHVWAGTLGEGLYHIEPATGKTDVFMAKDSGLASDYVLSAMEGRDGKMYFGTSGGLTVYDPVARKMESYLEEASEESPGNQSVNQIYEDSRGLLWLATRNGLRAIDRQRHRMHNVPLRDNISQLSILGLTEDNGGSLWVTEGSNLVNLKVMYDETTGDLRVTPKVYDSRDGLQNSAFNQRSFGKLPDGEIAVGGLYGIDRFRPDRIRYNTARPKVMFSDLHIGNRRVSVGEKIDGQTVMERGLNSGSGLEFGPGQKEFTVSFATDNYALPEKTVFRYRLKGFTDEWTESAQGENHATYTNLSPGRYTLQVKAVNSDGYESESPAELQIYVRPPFWATAWAYAVYSLLLAAAIYMAFRLLRRRERKRFERRREEDERAREEEMNQLKFKFFTNVSHDLRTPLTLIISPLETMLKEAKEEKQARRLTLMRNNAMKLLNLVNQLLDFRKMEMKGLSLNPSEGDIVAFAKGVCTSFANMSERKNINLTFYSSQERIDMMFDPDKMEKILMNLLGNAFKFTPAGGRVDVSVELTGDSGETLRIKVADTGRGISDKEKEHIFERFYQIDDDGGRHPGMGSGIGLSMVAEYVRLHEGTVRVADNAGGGSVFVIEMPAMPAKADRSDKSDQSDRSDGSDKSDRTDRPMALIVDDNPDIREMIKAELDADFEIVTASDGVEALEKTESLTPDIIVTDLMMPRMDGIELTRRLKSRPETSGIPLLILTARHDLDTKVEGLTTGADDYVTKPFNIEVLRLRMKKLIDLARRGARRGLIDPEPENIKITPLDEKFIGKAVDYVSKNIDNPVLSVEDLAASLGMSRVALYRRIKQITGKTPIEFIRVIRLKRAAQMLRESQLNVSEIAYQTGFNNPKAFSRYFKEEFGLLPSVYQQREEKETNYTV